MKEGRKEKEESDEQRKEEREKRSSRLFPSVTVCFASFFSLTDTSSSVGGTKSCL